MSLLRLRIGAIILVGVVASIIFGLVFCQPITVLAQGSVLAIPSHRHLQYSFNETSSSPHATYGAFTSDNGVTLYVMSAAEFNNFTEGKPTPVIYSTGEATSASLNYGKNGGNSYAYFNAAGQYFFVFYNAGDSTTSVTITSALSVEKCQIPP